MTETTILALMLSLFGICFGLAVSVIRDRFALRASAVLSLLCIAGAATVLAFAPAVTHAATSSFTAHERELGARKFTPTVAAGLPDIPPGTQHAEIYIEGGDALVRWIGGAPVDSATGAMKWPEGHFRKEENDGQKLSGLRILCADCTVWVNYFGRR